MIREEHGRTFSVRTPDEVEELLRADIESLTPAERKVLAALLDELESGTDQEPTSIRHAFLNADYVREPVDMETFVRDEYYLGNTCDVLYDQWLQDLTELFEGDYEEAIFTGAIGTGKTFAASIGVCRIIYELSCLRDPQRSLGIARGSNISIVVLSVNEFLAMKAAFENITTKIQASPYFTEHFPFKAIQKEIRFPNKIWVAPRATTDHTSLGLNVVATLLDETNFLKKGQHPSGVYVDQAKSLYTGLLRRMKSRFEKRGKLPGIMFLVSSKQTSDDFTAERVVKSMNNPKVFCRDYGLWDVKPDEYADADTFAVLCGNDQVSSRILSEDEAKPYRVEGGLPEGSVLIDVPVSFRQDFVDDLEGAIRDIAGIATVAVRPFIANREKIYAAIDPSRTHPFSVEVWDPSTPGSFIWERMVQDTERRGIGGRMEKFLEPILTASATRHARFDQSLTRDATGFAMGHIAGYKDVKRKDEENRVYAERAPVIVIDFLLRIVPPVGGEIVLAELRRLLYELTNHGYPITKVTLDQFQSADAVQTLNRQGYTAELLSVDLSTDPYEALKAALYEERLLFYSYQPLIDELKTLQRNLTKSGHRAKIDHPPKGSKDVADALAGVVHTLSKDRAHDPLPIMQTRLAGEDPWMEEQRRSLSTAENTPLSEYARQTNAPLPIMGPLGSPGWTPPEGGGWETL